MPRFTNLPRFLISLGILSVLLWGVVLIIAASLPPDSEKIKAIFLFMLVLATGVTLSAVFYPIYYKRDHLQSDYIAALKKGFKLGFYLSFVICGILGLRAFELASILNILLFLFLSVAIYTQLHSSKRP